MAVGLVKELLKLNRLLGEESIQAIVEGDIVVPDTKPDISRILSVKSKVKIVDTEIIQEKILVDGIVNFEILYTSPGAERPVHSMNASASFNESIQFDGINSTMDPEVTYVLEHVEYNILNERKLSVKAILKLMAKVYENEEGDIVQELEGVEDAQVLEDYIEYNQNIGNNSSQSVLRETYELTEDNPEMAEILGTEGIPVVEEVKVTDGKVIVGGNVNIRILYATDEPRNPVNEIKHEMPFTQFVEVPKATEDMECVVSADVENIYTELKENLEEEKKIYDIEVVVKIMAKVYDRAQKRVLLDAYCPSRKMNLVKNNVKYLKNICCNSSQTVIRETLDIPEELPNIFKVFTVDVKPTMTDYRLVEEKNIIEGFIEATVVYVSDNEEMEVHSFTEEIPFRHYIDTPGAKDGVIADTSINVIDVDYSKLNPQQVEVKVALNAESCLKEENEKYVLVDIEDLGEVQEDDDKASITIYFIQEGDSLWEIAKRYNTTVKEIVETNDIEDPENIIPGNTIIIQKNYEYKL